MTDAARLRDLVQARIDEFLDVRAPILAAIAGEASWFEAISRDFLRGGKRFRAQFAFRGWQAVQAGDASAAPWERADPRELDAMVGVASALELFHAAALVHDDLMDNSDTRRGAPAAHRRFETHHRDAAFVGDAATFGRSAALLLGDLLLVWSDELFAEALDRVPDRDRARAARREFDRMRTDVTAGQFLDILEEGAWARVPEEEAVPRARRVIVYKSAKYSIEAPLLIGASLGGASLGQLDALSGFGLPLGVAYQLRDDLLGVFGDAEVTGKPSGDDLVEGKRTVLVALTRSAVPAGSRRLIDELLGDPDLDRAQVAMLQETIRGSGALDEVETMIAAHAAEALAALDGSGLRGPAADALRELVTTVSDRIA